MGGGWGGAGWVGGGEGGCVGGWVGGWGGLVGWVGGWVGCVGSRDMSLSVAILAQDNELQFTSYKRLSIDRCSDSAYYSALARHLAALDFNDF